MSSTERTRDADRTRRAILDAFGRMLEERGSNVSLADVARAAGVTKSGLMHHFRSRDDLVAAFVDHGIEMFWSEVQALVDHSESRPGQFTRAYVRAMTGDSAHITRWASATSLIAHLGSQATIEHLERIAPHDAARLDAAFAADGLPVERTLLIRLAADGAALSWGTPYLDAERLASLRAQLFALSEATEGTADATKES
ncbi:helix-turn-helix transcriptional regulator [Nocardioides sp. zg-536]|uniref:Helix-turn-helix transcriptional regulator n=1 Tax=Nocardioides faecalis TaxID=2803858 RepID=A0A938Y4H0_9ACTN|nr:TetR/AcrR family transcriptional regulator [Nocardioides faecalis]MBM9459022.1 helix-turn-helix transcriptional regulator [Nocardioides faecalis]QVI57289.1 helix-turn-helix transcriptional regulator [Nocardioides faecalis]